MLLIQKYLTFIVAIILLAGCVSIEKQRADIERDIAVIYSDYNNEIRQFFVEEAVKADVRTIRAMKQSEKLQPVHPNEIQGCAYGFWKRKLILIEVNQPLCLKLGHLAHEIAHVGSKCSAHNDTFYRYNFAIAKRYEAHFPNATKRRWFSPVQSVANVAAIYRSDGC